MEYGFQRDVGVLKIHQRPAALVDEQVDRVARCVDSLNAEARLAVVCDVGDSGRPVRDADSSTALPAPAIAIGANAEKAASTDGSGVGEASGAAVTPTGSGVDPVTLVVPLAQPTRTQQPRGVGVVSRPQSTGDYHPDIQRSTGPRHRSSGGTRLVARRADPTRIDAARREATRQRLLSTGMLPDRVHALMTAWETEAGRRGLPEGRRYADELAWDWMVAQRARQLPGS